MRAPMRPGEANHPPPLHAGMTTFLLMTVDTLWSSKVFGASVIGYAYAYGGGAQMVAGVLEVRAPAPLAVSLSPSLWSVSLSLSRAGPPCDGAAPATWPRAAARRKGSCARPATARRAAAPSHAASACRPATSRTLSPTPRRRPSPLPPTTLPTSPH
jgi:hypothetical protein